MACSVADVTVNVVPPETPPKLAVIPDVPAAMPLATPPAVIVATEVAPEDQVASDVTFRVVPSE